MPLARIIDRGDHAHTCGICAEHIAKTPVVDHPDCIVGCVAVRQPGAKGR
jgi:hypothetical protein